MNDYQSGLKIVDQVLVLKKLNSEGAALADPYDSATGQVDTVSLDAGIGGSFIPLLADMLMTDYGCPVAFVPCALGGTAISQHLPGANHLDRATLYGSANYRAGVVGGARCVLWWQGETDGVNGTSQATYNSSLDTIANAWQADRGIKLMPAKLQTCSGVSDPNEALIRAAIADAWADNANVLTGPDLVAYTSDDAFHLQTDAKLLAAAGLWRTAITTAFPP